MINKVRREKKPADFYIFVGNFLIICLVLGTFVFNKHYSSDDFFCYYDQNGEADAVIFSSYRIVLGIVYMILSYLKINVVTHQIIFGIFMLMCFACSVTLITITIKNIMLKKGKDINVLFLSALNIGSLMLIVNVFISEWVWFSLGYIQWGISVLFSVLGAVYFIKGSIKNYIVSFISLFIAAGCYQISISIYVYVVLLFILCTENGKISAILVKDTIKAALPAIFSIILNVVFTKILVLWGWGFSGGRISFSVKSIIDKSNMLWKNEIEIWKNGMGLLPQYFMSIVGILYFLLIIYSLLHCKVKWNFIAIAISVLAGTGVMCMPVLLQDSFYQPARMIVPIGCVFLVLHICVVIMNLDGKKFMLQCTVILGIFYLGINFIEIQKNSIDGLKTCSLEEKEVDDILKYIEAYEEENNCVVDTVAFDKDEYPTYKYYNEIQSLNYGGEMYTRAILVDWSDIQLLNFYSGKNYNKIINEETKSKFEKSNYDYFSVREQIYIEGNVAYISLY